MKEAHSGDILYIALRALVDISREKQQEFKEEFPHYSPTSWAREICTIKVATARRAGHTTAIFRLVEDALPRSVVAVFGPKWIARDFRGKPGFYCSHKDISSLDYMKRNHEGTELDAVICDVSSHLSSKEIDTVYELYLYFMSYNRQKGKPFFFIFVH